MRKQLLTLALVAAFAAPAAAQSSYDDSAANIAAGSNSGLVEPGTSNDMRDGSGIDDSTTGSIVVAPDNRNPGLCENGAGGDPSSSAQCEFYGANSH